MRKQNRFMFTLMVVVLLILGALLLWVGIIYLRYKFTDWDISNDSGMIREPKDTSGENLMSYTNSSFSFDYPSGVLYVQPGPVDDNNVFLTNKVNVDSPRALPEDGIWLEVTVYPSTAKTGLMSDVNTILKSPILTEVTHPITPYTDKFIKEKNLSDNGFILISSDTKDVDDAKEVTTAIWVKDDKVYQLRVVVMKQSVFEEFKPSFNKILESFRINNYKI